MVHQNGYELFPDDVYCGDKFRCDRYSGDIFTVTDSMQSNNGNFRAVDQNGKLVWFNTVSDDIEIIQRTTETRDNRVEWIVFKREYDEKIKASKAIRISNPVKFYDEYDECELDSLEGMCLPNDSDL